MRQPAPSTRSAPALSPFWSATYPATPDQVRRARRALVTFLGGAPLATDAIICLSELATNSIEHSNSRTPGGRLTIRATLTAGWLHVAVRDQGGPWQQASPNGDAQRGRGLHIVGALAKRWGAAGDGATSRTVWFEMASHPATDQPPNHQPPGTEETAMPPSSPPEPSVPPEALTAEAIAGDYPGWDIGHNGRFWTATCPTISVQADTPDGLRAALERVTCPERDTP